MADLKFFMPSPSPLPNCGILFAPKITMTIKRMTISSWKPKLGIVKPPFGSNAQITDYLTNPMKSTATLARQDKPGPGEKRFGHGATETEIRFLRVSVAKE